MNIDTKEILSHFLGWCMMGSIVILITIIISYRLTCRNYDELQQQKPDISISSAVQNQNQYQLRLNGKTKTNLKEIELYFWDDCPLDDNSVSDCTIFIATKIFRKSPFFRNIFIFHNKPKISKPKFLTFFKNFMKF